MRPFLAHLARRLPGLGTGALRMMLQVLQARLGTPEEQPPDFARVRLLAHEISNRATAENLASDLRRLDAAPGASPS